MKRLLNFDCYFGWRDSIFTFNREDLSGEGVGGGRGEGEGEIFNLHCPKFKFKTGKLLVQTLFIVVRWSTEIIMGTMNLLVTSSKNKNKTVNGKA